MMQLAENDDSLKKVFKTKIFIGSLFRFMSVRKCAELTQSVYGACHNNNSKYVTVPAGRKHYFGEIYKREDFVETKKETFEGHSWCVPKSIDMYLSHMYGKDYMEVPDESKREKHVLLELKFPDEEK